MSSSVPGCPVCGSPPRIYLRHTGFPAFGCRVESTAPGLCRPDNPRETIVCHEVHVPYDISLSPGQVLPAAEGWWHGAMDELEQTE